MRLKRDFECAPEGHTVVTIPAGTEVSGKVARWAEDAGAVDKRGKKKKVRKPQVTKPASPNEPE